MLEEIQENQELLEEYEDTFDNEEKISHAMKLSKESFKIDTGVVDFDSLLVPDPIKIGRKETHPGLSTSIAELGILNPIHVMITEGYALWTAEHPDEEYEGYKFILLDGFRRVWGGYKNGLKRCFAVIWDFEDKDKGNELSIILSRVLNKVQKHSWTEVWDMYKILMAQSPLTENTLDYLLHLESGDSTKLKSIMENADKFPEPKDDLLSNKKTLQQAFNMLEKMRKEVDKLAEEDNRGISEMEQAEGVVEKAGDEALSDEQVREILEMSDDFDEELSDSDFDETLSMDDGVYDRQKVGERHPLNPALKAETMARDEYTCQCCGAGKDMPYIAKMSILQSHHRISVSNSGPDSAENIVTICMVCHTLVHVILRNGLKIGMSKEQFGEMSEGSQKQFKKIMALARVDWEAGKRLGKNKEQISKENSNYSKFKMPGTDLAENREAMKTLKS